MHACYFIEPAQLQVLSGLNTLKTDIFCCRHNNHGAVFTTSFKIKTKTCIQQVYEKLQYIVTWCVVFSVDGATVSVYGETKLINTVHVQKKSSVEVTIVPGACSIALNNKLSSHHNIAPVDHKSLMQLRPYNNIKALRWLYIDYKSAKV